MNGRSDLSQLLGDSEAAPFTRSGHFVYESGDHGDTWLELDLLFADPRQLRRAAGALAARLEHYAPDIVCGPLVGGGLLGQWIAYDLNTTFVTAAGPRYAVPAALRSAVREKRVLVVDDAINAGAATLTCVREIEAVGGRVVAVGALLVRIPGALDLWRDRHLPIEYLAGLSWATWPATACPLCHAGIPLDAP